MILWQNSIRFDCLSALNLTKIFVETYLNTQKNNNKLFIRWMRQQIDALENASNLPSASAVGLSNNCLQKDDRTETDFSNLEIHWEEIATIELHWDFCLKN